MVKSYLEDIDFLLTPERQIRFNKKQNRLYIDMDFNSMSTDDYIVIDCFRALNHDFTKVYNDPFKDVSCCIDEKTMYRIN